MSESRMFNKRFSSMFVVGRSAGQNIPNLAWTVIEWDWQLYDELDEITIINPWTFIPKLAGYYYFNVHARLNDLNVGDIYQLYFQLNAVNAMAAIDHQAANLNEDIALNLSVLQFLIPTDAVGVVVRHNFGAGRTLSGNQNETRFLGYRVR